MKNGEREYVLVLKLKIEWVGGIEKELNLNELKVGMELNRKAIWIQFFSITDDDFLLVPWLTTLYWPPFPVAARMAETWPTCSRRQATRDR